MALSAVNEENTLYSGNYLALDLINYTDEKGVKRTWESAVRTRSTPAVMILPVIRPDNEVVIIRQFRPPTHRYMLPP